MSSHPMGKGVGYGLKGFQQQRRIRSCEQTKSISERANKLWEDFQMTKKPTYEELELKVKELEKIDAQRKQAKQERGKRSKTEPSPKDGMLKGKEALPKKNILIADDDQVILGVLKEMIHREGYRVFLASNGKEAVEAIQVNPIDLAILDIKMPVMDGIEALEKIKEIDQSVEVLIMTGYADFETLGQAISDHKAFDYILKPFKRDEILKGIQKALLKRDFDSRKRLREEELEERILQLEKEFHERTHQLRESQIKYKDIVENSNDAIVVVQGGKLKFANTKTVELTGYPQEELKGMSFLEIVHPEDRDIVAEGYRSEDFPNTFSSRALRKSGESLWVEINAVRTTWEKRQATLNIIRDITERKLVDETLRESEEKYRTILESIEDGYYEVDIKGNLTFFNDSMCKILGYSRDKLMGMNNRKYTDEETARKVYEAFNKVYTTGEPKKILDEEIIRKDGTKRHIETSVSLIKDAGGNPAGFRGIFRDVTERKKMEIELIRANNFLQNIFDSSIDGITTTDLQGIIIYTSPRVKDILGYEQEEVIGKKIYSLYHKGKEDAKAIMKELTEKGELRDHETISLAMTAAETGHLVFGTLHTSSALKSINRIIDSFPENQHSQVRTQLAESLKAVIAQKLYPRIDQPGMVPVVEILISTPAVSNLIRESKNFQISSVIQTGLRYGMQSFEQSKLNLIKQEIIEMNIKN